jgi:hypothetical protein
MLGVACEVVEIQARAARESTAAVTAAVADLDEYEQRAVENVLADPTPEKLQAAMQAVVQP